MLVAAAGGQTMSFWWILVDLMVGVGCFMSAGVGWLILVGWWQLVVGLCCEVQRSWVIALVTCTDEWWHHWWYIPSEKIGQNIDPLRNSFFVANYQHWTSTRALEPFLGPLDPWGALGGPWVVWGGLTTQKLPFSFRDQSKPWNGLFWLTITSYTMFLRFWVKMGPSGPKKGCFWPK